MHTNNIYLIENIFKAPRICASRADDGLVGAPFAALEILKQDIDFVKANLTSLYREPIFISSASRPAFLLPSHWGSSHIVEVITLDLSINLALAVVHRGALNKMLIAPSLDNVQRRERIQAPQCEPLVDLCDRFDAVKSLSSVVEKEECQREVLLAEEFLSRSAKFLGIEYAVVGKCPFGLLQNYDRSAMASFLTLSLLVVRDKALTRTGNFSFFLMGDQLVVVLDAECFDGACESFSHFRRLSSSLNSYMIAEQKGKHLHIEMSCCRPEVSSLGLKRWLELMC